MKLESLQNDGGDDVDVFAEGGDYDGKMRPALQGFFGDVGNEVAGRRSAGDEQVKVVAFLPVVYKSYNWFTVAGASEVLSYQLSEGATSWRIPHRATC